MLCNLLIVQSLRKEKSMAKRDLSLVVFVFVAVCLVFCPATVGDDVVIDPPGSRLWSTVTSSSVVLPVPWPQGAATATLSVPAVGRFAGVEVVLTKGVDYSYTLSLPRPSAPNDEYVVSPAIEFRNAGGETLAPKLESSFAVVSEVAPYRGTDVTASEWAVVKKGTYALPKPTNEVSFRSGYGNLVATNMIPQCCAWMPFAPRKSGTYVLSLYGEDGELSLSAMLDVLTSGIVFSLR